MNEIADLGPLGLPFRREAKKKNIEQSPLVFSAPYDDAVSCNENSAELQLHILDDFILLQFQLIIENAG